MRLVLFIFSLSLFLPNAALAASGIEDCFEEEQNSGISMCLTMITQDAENTRKTMEKELEQMISSNAFIPPPNLELDEDAYEIDFQITPTSSEDARAQEALEQALERQKFEQLKREEFKLKVKMTTYDRKKQEIMRQHEESKALFEKYRDVECKRHKAKIDDEDRRYERAFVEKICRYEMTLQRIKSLQKSIE